MAAPHCPYCHSSKPMRKAGILVSRDVRYRRQRYQCRHCRRFSVNPKFR